MSIISSKLVYDQYSSGNSILGGILKLIRSISAGSHEIGVSVNHLQQEYYQGSIGITFKMRIDAFRRFTNIFPPLLPQRLIQVHLKAKLALVDVF